MIQLVHIQIEEFRGIRNIGIYLNSQTFVVYGPNGSGKSGVVDAIDFALTGSIRRLAGKGMGAVSISQHAPHVHVRGTPDLASVSLTIKDTATGKTAVLKRSVGSPKKFSLTPNDADVRRSLEQAQEHPELTLSRREIIQYVVSPPADRAAQVQSLLKLDHLSTFRKNLSTAANKAKSELGAAEKTLSAAETALLSHLNVADLESPTVLGAINKRRLTLGVTELSVLDETTDFLSGITAESGTPTVNLKNAVSETGNLIDALGDFTTIDAKREALSNSIDKAGDGPELISAIQRRSLLSSGLSGVADEACPLCGLEWPDIDSLRRHIESEIQGSENARLLVAGLETPRDTYVTAVNALRSLVLKVIETAKAYGDRELPVLLTTWTETLTDHSKEFSSNEKALGAAELLTSRQYDAPLGVKEKLKALEASLAALPEQSATVDAHTFLAVANQLWTPVVLARKNRQSAEGLSELAAMTYEAYCYAVEESLETLYRTVEHDFSRYYRVINSDDEGDFSARFTQTQSSLDLAVDFYGIDMFPPNAYHSEGHQDGMGVCLYLALMKQRLASDFRLAVFDDVVMSVDADHRRQFCELLKAEFPNVQFIITTHDQVWARQMESAGLITRKQQMRFYGWTVDDGPLDEQVDVWNRIDADLSVGDVNSAAHKLRRHLEAATADIAEAIGGRVTFRSDANYGLGDFLSAVKSRHGDLLKQATASANSWENASAQADVQEKKEARATAIKEHDGESWAVNVLVHQNDWAPMSVSDFKPVLEASKSFLNLFLCSAPNCGGWIHASGFNPEALRCDCGEYSLNLVKKSPA